MASHTHTHTHTHTHAHVYSLSLSRLLASQLVNGHDVTKDVKAAQHSLGICPQHDVLFDTLTVEEHLKFFCRLKGVRCAHLTQLVECLHGV